MPTRRRVPWEGGARVITDETIEGRALVPGDVVHVLGGIAAPTTWDRETRDRLRVQLVNALFAVNESEADLRATLAALLALDPSEADALWSHVDFDAEIHLNERAALASRVPQ